MLNHFTFNGHSTAEYGLLVTALNPYSAPSRRIEKVEIPYRNGDLVIDSGVYNNIIVSYEVSVINNTKDNFEALRNWLLTSQGYHQLSDTINTDSFRVGCYYQSVDATLTALYKYGKAVISFDCFPQRYLTTNTPITTTATADTTTDTTLSLSTVPTPINISLNGNTTQEGSSGKNLQDLSLKNYQTSITSNGVTLDYNATKFRLHGTATASGGRTGYALLSVPLTRGTYTISAQNITGTIGQLYGFLQNSSNTVIGSAFGFTGGATPATVTVSASDNYYIGFNVTSGETYDVYFNIQLEKGSTATAYEPHISPTNPQVIHSVSGDNTVNVISKNILSPFTVGIGLDANTGAERTASNMATTDFISVDFNAHPYYYISGLDATLHTYICAYNSYKQFLHRTGSTFRDNELLATTTFIGGTPQGIGDIAFLRVTYSRNSGDTGDINNVNNHLSQLEIGNSRTDFEPYTRQSYPLYLPVENLNKIADVKSGWLPATGAYPTTNGSYPNAQYLIVPLNKGETCYLSGTTNIKGRVRAMNTSTVIGTVTANTTYYTTTADQSSGFKDGSITALQDLLLGILFMDGYASSGGNELIIAKGTNVQNYSIELNKIGTRQDYIYKNGGKWYLYKEFNKVDLGTLTWEKQVSSSIDVGYYFQTQQVTLVPSTTRWLCTSYPNTGYTGLSNIVANLGRGVDKIGFSAGGTLFYIIDSGYTEATAFKSSVSGKYLIYSTNAPTNTEITDTTLINQLNNIEKAYSYNGTTNILQVSNENGFMLSVLSLHANNVSSTYKGEPIITVNSTGLIYFNGCVIKVNQAPMTINSQTMQAYNGTVNLNNYIEANDFPMIEPGNNVIGSEMPLTIVPNYWKL